MKRIIINIFMCISILVFSSFIANQKKYKFLIQMTNYEGEGAYVVVSLISPKGKYEKTLYVQGKDPDWYYEIESWWKFYGKNRTKLDGISGSTLSDGERAIKFIQLDESKINNGYKIRFESAVEAKNYYEKDIEFKLTDSNLQKKFNGKGFIRYVRMLPQ